MHRSPSTLTHIFFAVTIPLLFLSCSITPSGQSNFDYNSYGESDQTDQLISQRSTTEQKNLDDLKPLETKSENEVLRRENIKLRNKSQNLESDITSLKTKFNEDIKRYQNMVSTIEKQYLELKKQNQSLLANKINRETIAEEPLEELTLDQVIHTPEDSKAVQTASLKKSNSTSENSSSQENQTQFGEFKDSIINPPELPIKTSSNFTVKKVYDDGYRLFIQKKYEDAIDSFNMFLRRFATDTYADNALFWLGMSYWAKEDFKNSERYFREILSKYEHGEPKNGFKTADAIYMLGKIANKQGRRDQAKFYFQAVRTKYSNSTPARLALKEMPELENME